MDLYNINPLSTTPFSLLVTSMQTMAINTNDKKDDELVETSDDPVDFTTKLLPTLTAKDRTDLFDILGSIYNKQFRPPGYNDNMLWAKNAYTEQTSFEKYAKVAR